MNAVACRLPSVIVPVLSSSSVSTSPAASTARPDIASTLCCTSRSMPGDADRRDEGADRRRHQADEQRDEHRDRHRRAGVLRERLQGDDDEQEDQRQDREQDVQRDLVRRLLAPGAFDERDHPVEEGLAGVRGDAHRDRVRQDARAGGDRRSIAAGLADHRRRFAGDRRLVDAGDARDDLAVAGDQLAGVDADEVAGAQRGRGDRVSGCHRRGGAPSSRRAPGEASPPAPCRGLRPSPRRGWRTAP